MVNKRLFILSPLTLFCLFYALSISHAHQPHDIIQGLEVSPSFDSDGTIFALVYPHKLKKSIDGGNSWKELVNGLDNKRGRFSFIAATSSFVLDDTLFLASEGDGIYKSQDGGTSWIKQNEGVDNLNIGIVACSPNYYSDQIVLAAGTEGGMYKTYNGGLNWYTVMEFEGIIVTAIAFSPDFANDNTVFFGDDSGNLYLSNDDGESAQRITKFTCFSYPCNQRWWRLFNKCKHKNIIKSIVFSPIYFTDGTIFIGTFGCGVHKSVDRGANFFKVNQEISDKFITSLAISPAYEQDLTIFAAGKNEAVFQSNDGGNSWEKYSTGIPYADQGNIHYQFLAISNNFVEDGTIFLGAFEGVFKSSDRGNIWLEVETVSAGEVQDIALSPDYLNDSNVFIATYGGGAYKSDDKGHSWTVNNIGLERAFTYDVEFSPNYASDNTVFLLQYDYVAKSTNGGETWSLNKISDEKTIVPTVIVPSPDLINDNTLFVGTRHNGVFKSIDKAQTWFPVLESINNVISMAISPDFSFDGTLYVGTGITKINTEGMGVLKTVDGGNTWQPVNNGLTSMKSVRLAISPNYHVDETLFAGTENGVFKTSNGGEAWEKLAGNAYIGNGLIEAIAISPNYENDKTLITAVRGVGLYKADNGGLNWFLIGNDLIENNYSLRKITFSPSYAVDNTIFGSTPTKLYKSTDGGYNWDIINRPVRYENTRDLVHYLGNWRISKDYGDYVSALGFSYSDAPDDLVLFNFVGTGISWIGTMSDMQGIAEIYVDGVFSHYIDQYNATPRFMETLYSSNGLSFGPHTIVVKVTDSKNPAASDYYVVIDAFDVIQ